MDVFFSVLFVSYPHEFFSSHVFLGTVCTLPSPSPPSQHFISVPPFCSHYPLILSTPYPPLLPLPTHASLRSLYISLSSSRLSLPRLLLSSPLLQSLHFSTFPSTPLSPATSHHYHSSPSSPLQLSFSLYICMFPASPHLPPSQLSLSASLLLPQFSIHIYTHPPSSPFTPFIS